MLCRINMLCRGLRSLNAFLVVIVIDSDFKQKFHQVVQKLTYSAAHCRTFLHRVELHLSALH